MTVIDLPLLDPPRAMWEMRTIMPEFSTLLDIGPGIRPCDFIKAEHHMAVEPHGTYIDVLAKECPRVDVRQGAWKDVREDFKDRTFEAVVALDVIEHMEREDGLRLRDDVLRMATRLAIIFTPFGFMHQEPIGVDPWGYDGMVWQKHRSGWMPEDFEDWHLIIGGTPKVMFAIKDYGVGLLGKLGLG